MRLSLPYVTYNEAYTSRNSLRHLGRVGHSRYTIIAVIKYKQIPNVPTIIGLVLIVVGVVIVHLMNDIDVK